MNKYVIQILFHCKCLKEMKNIVITIFLSGFIILISNTTEAQPPLAFKYQAVISNNEGKAITDKEVQLRISILKDSIDGNTVYTELHPTQTGKHGLVNLEIGKGENPTTDFAVIKWSDAPYFIKIEADVDGNGFRHFGTSQLLSVPFALNAGSLTLTAPNGEKYSIGVDNSGKLYTANPAMETVTDADGNVYKTVKIGNQVWMAENLRVGKMLHTVDSTFFYGLQTDNNLIEKFCYDNKYENCELYGGLYKWQEAMQYQTANGSQGICPEGWHIPTQDDWHELLANFSTETAGKELQIGGISGFNAVMTGGWFYHGIYGDGFHSGENDYGFTEYWSSTVVLVSSTYSYSVSSRYSDVGEHIFTGRDSAAYNIRCIKNNK